MQPLVVASGGAPIRVVQPPEDRAGDDPARTAVPCRLGHPVRHRHALAAVVAEKYIRPLSTPVLATAVGDCLPEIFPPGVVAPRNIGVAIDAHCEGCGERFEELEAYRVPPCAVHYRRPPARLSRG